MTTATITKIAEAKKMVAYMLAHKAQKYFIDGLFTPTSYEEMRWNWKGTTVSWATLKKYAEEIGLKTRKFEIEYHSDGSMLAELCGIPEGQTFIHTGYFFEG